MIKVLEQTYDFSNLILSIAEMSSFVDKGVSGHNYRVAFISYLIAKYLKPDDKAFIRKSLFSGIFHDIGVLAMRNADKVIKILLEKTTNEEDEKEIIVRHCKIGYRMLNSSIFSEEAEIIKHHHDTCNPETLNNVPEEAFIVRLADRIDVFIKNNTRYDLKREYSSIERNIRSYLDKTEGFHPLAVKVFIEYIAPREAFWLSIADEDVLKNLLSDLIKKYSYLVDYKQFKNLAQLLAYLIDFKSPFTATHSSGVAAVAKELSRLLEFSKVTQRRIELAGLLHDIGKIKVPTEILEKPGKLTEEEFNVMKSHIFYTYEILSKLNIEKEIVEWAAYHHETLDGKGYVLKLKEDEIPMGSRIMAVSDMFVALREKRPYREVMPINKAIGILNDNAKRGKIDKKVLNILKKNLEHIDRIREQVQKEAEEMYKKLLICDK